MEAPRGVEPTGTNGRRRHSSPFPLPCVGVGPRLCCCGIVGDKERCSCGHETVFASAVRFPDRHGTRRWRRVGGFLWPVGVPVLGVRAVGGGFCGGHGPGVTPGPFPNPEAKAWHGDGTAPGRVWESNTPPQTFVQVGFPVEPTLRETPPFLYPVPDGIPLDGLAAPGRFFFAFSCRRSSGSSAAFITTRSMCFPEAQAGIPRRRVHKSNVWLSAICRRSSP